ncbi:MAG: helix-turn-helix domain-containing protein [Lachnospiraceae bacterium]|nr:helix-turn-helix domain-containing protein [Lachnospiraceae bacterium]
MKRKLQTAFQSRQYMLSQDFEIYYYNDTSQQKVNMHTHNYYEFYLFLEGDISIQIGENIFPLQYGDIILIPPNIPHMPVYHSTRIPYRRFVFWLSQEYCNHLLTISPDYVYLMQYVQVHKRYIFHNDRITFNSVQSKANNLIDEMRSNRFGRDAQITLYVNDLILHLNRLIHERNTPKSPALDTSLYHRLNEYIETHIEDELTLEHLAGEFYISKYHIAHVFKEATGLSIHQYITKKRLALCKEALLDNISITEVYQSFGFGDYSSFYRAFKKEFGISPKEYKKSTALPSASQ